MWHRARYSYVLRNVHPGFEPRRGEGTKDFPFSISVQTGTRAHPASCKIRNWPLSQVGKMAEAWRWPANPI